MCQSNCTHTSITSESATFSDNLSDFRELAKRWRFTLDLLSCSARLCAEFAKNAVSNPSPNIDSSRCPANAGDMQDLAVEGFQMAGWPDGGEWLLVLAQAAQIENEVKLAAELACSDCGARYDGESLTEDDFHRTHDGDVVCQSCVDENYATAYDGDLYHTDDLVWIESEEEYYPETSSRVVAATDHNGNPTYELTRNVVVTADGTYLTQRAYEEDYFTCESCDSVLHNDHYAMDGVCYACDESRAEDEDDAVTRSIHEYDEDVLSHYSAVPVAKDEKRRYTLGVELEIEDMRDYAYDVCEELEGMAILKNDGSLHRGFEVVTVPAPYSWHVGDMWTEERLRRWSQRYGGRSFNTQTCGLHIHVGRSWLTPLQIAKTMVFINNPDNLRFIELVAQRDISRWASQKPTDWSNTGKGRDKYEALRTTKGPTVEFRIFKGTLARDGIVRALQFVTTVLDHQSCASDKGVPVRDAHKLRPYLMALCASAKANIELVSWLAKKGVLKEEDGKFTPVERWVAHEKFTPIVSGRKSAAAAEREAARERQRQAAVREQQVAMLPTEDYVRWANQHVRDMLHEGGAAVLSQDMIAVMAQTSWMRGVTSGVSQRPEQQVTLMALPQDMQRMAHRGVGVPIVAREGNHDAVVRQNRSEGFSGNFAYDYVPEGLMATALFVYDANTDTLPLSVGYANGDANVMLQRTMQDMGLVFSGSYMPCDTMVVLGNSPAGRMLVALKATLALMAAMGVTYAAQMVGRSLGSGVTAVVDADSVRFEFNDEVRHRAYMLEYMRDHWHASTQGGRDFYMRPEERPASNVPSAESSAAA